MQSIPGQVRSPRLDDALVAWRNGRRAEAETLCRTLLSTQPRAVDALRFLAEIFQTSGRTGDAIRACRSVLELAPDDAATLRRLAGLLGPVDATEAMALLHRSLQLEPHNPRALNNLGILLIGVGRYAESIPILQSALAAQPEYPVALNNLGLALAAVGRGHEALAAYEKSAQLDPANFEVFLAVGRLLLRLGHLDNAHAAFCEALRLRPANLLALEGRTMTLVALNRSEEALPGLEALLVAAPAIDYLAGVNLHARLQCCDWRDLETRSRELTERVRRGERADAPLSFLAHNDSPADQRRCAEVYCADRCAAAGPRDAEGEVAGATGAVARSGCSPARLRVAYLSTDFRDHPVAQLIAGVIESHDRSRLEIFGYSAGVDDGSPSRRRLERGFEHFVDVSPLSDAAIAARLAESSIDIVVDLGGHTTGSRTRALAHRPAPVQVAFLGYPGTTGADFIDYLIADKYVIPEADLTHHREQVIHLPDSYLPNDFMIQPSPSPSPSPSPRRVEVGLPDAGFVFCCFNAPYKILPTMFDIWMQILKRVPDAVLWLRAPSAMARRNLADASKRRGVDPDRLVYAHNTATLEEHHARLALADAFLDTHPYNAHTTASDALRAGVPVVTLRGKSFVSRVATSLVHAVGLGHLSADSAEDYERMAVELALAPGLVKQLKSHLHRARSTAPLFNTQRYCRHLEAAYREIWHRHRRGEAPSFLQVQPVQGD